MTTFSMENGMELNKNEFLRDYILAIKEARETKYETYHLRAVALHKAQKAYEEALNDSNLGDEDEDEEL